MLALCLGASLAGAVRVSPLPLRAPARAPRAAFPQLRFSGDMRPEREDDRIEGAWARGGEWDDAPFAPPSPLGAPRLGGMASPMAESGGRIARPLASRATVSRTDAGSLVIDMPAGGLGAGALMGGAFSVTWFAVIGRATVAALSGGGLVNLLFLTPFWLAGGNRRTPTPQRPPPQVGAPPPAAA